MRKTGRKAWLYVDKWSKPEYTGIKLVEPQILRATEVTEGVFHTTNELADMVKAAQESVTQRLLCADHREEHKKGKTCLACRLDEAVKAAEVRGAAALKGEAVKTCTKVIEESRHSLFRVGAKVAGNAISKIKTPATTAHDTDTHNAAIAPIVNFIAEWGGVDGGHHKQWVLDQLIRLCKGDGYAQWVEDYEGGEDGPETYSWDEGIAP